MSNEFKSKGFRERSERRSEIRKTSQIVYDLGSEATDEVTRLKARESLSLSRRQLSIYFRLHDKYGAFPRVRIESRKETRRV